MTRARFTEEQIIGILQEHEAGAKCPDLCRKQGTSEGTFYAWKSKFGGMTVSGAKRLKALDRAMVRHWSEDNGEGEWQAEAVAGGDDGPVAYSCRSKCSFRPLGVRRPRGFFLPMLNADGVGYRSRLCIGRWRFRLGGALPKSCARSTRP